MAELTVLSSAEHGSLKVVENCALEVARKQHVVNIRVAEVGMAVSSFPVFASKNPSSGRWALTAVTSFVPESNLFVVNDRWTATYLPTCMQTYPLFLMNSDEGENQYTVGIHAQSPDFSTEAGEALFDDQGKASLFLSRVTAMLEADINNDIQTYQFTDKLNELGLYKSINLLVHSSNGASVQTIQGLYTIDEEKLQQLDATTLEDLNKRGYLAPMYAMLTSIFQANALIRLNNLHSDMQDIREIKLEVVKDS
ncbi:MAG: SapC family protein [Halioglobus sp.]